MRDNRIGNRRELRCALLLIAVLCTSMLPEDSAWGRGGGRPLRWGYRPPAGDPLANNFLFADPWSAMNGGGIPRRNLGPANLNRASPGSGGRQGSTGSLPGRQTIFPGASSQASRSTVRSPSAAAGASVSSFTPASRSPAPAPTEQILNPPYYHDENDDWHHGYWGGGLWGWAGWDKQLGAWSVPRWRVGPWYYTSGYGRYADPFVANDASLKAYETVIEVEFDNQLDDSAEGSNGDQKPDVPVEPAAEKPLREDAPIDEAPGRLAFQESRAAFRDRDYARSLTKVEEALKTLHHDPAVHEFRGLILFAQGQFRQAAAVIYDVLAVSPGWDWTTLSSLYADPDEYTRQLRALEEFRKANPEVAEAAFMVAYHYATCGHFTIAVRHLRNVTRLLPDDNLTPHLLTLLTDAAADSSSESTPASPAANASASVSGVNAEAIDGSKLIGTWKASRGGNVRIELTLKDDGRFDWSVDDKGHREEFHGKYQIGRNLMLLSCHEGTFVGVLTQQSLGGAFHFRVLENSPPDMGLLFDK